MDSILPAQPYRSFSTGGGDAPMYLVSFDKDGNCTSPEHRRRILHEVATGGYTDVHVYSHGWNNVFAEAVDHYAEFFDEYFGLRTATRIDNASYRPLVIGILWPGTALVADDEAGPMLLNLASTTDDAIKELSAEMAGGDAAHFLSLVTNAQMIDQNGAYELATLLAPVLARAAAPEEGYRAPVTPEGLVAGWQATAGGSVVRRGAPGRLSAPATRDFRSARAVGNMRYFNPREIIRKATVYRMKDRAGRVGARGAGPLVADLLGQGCARVHMAGHSYGAKLVLSALSEVEHPRKVASLLLLQAAVNTYCFAQHIAENGGRQGGYRIVLDRVEAPVLSTFSANDRALNNFFPLALRRSADVAEARTLGLPHKFAALGAIGPSGMRSGEVLTLPILDRPARYSLNGAGVRVYALDGSAGAIRGHGDVRNRFTEWAMANLVDTGRAQ